MSDRWTRLMGEAEPEDQPLAEAQPRCVIVLADFSRSAARAPARAVDRDELDGFLARLAPRLEVEIEGVGALVFEHWKDFTPSGMVGRSAALSALVHAREAGLDAPDAEAMVGTDPLRVSADPGADGASLLDDMLGGGAERSRRDDNAFARAIRAIADAAPSVPRRSPERRARVDAELRRRIRLTLAHPEFRGLEASWLALRRLVRELETGETLRIRVVDAGRDTLEPALAQLAQALPEGERAGLLVAAFPFDASEDDRLALGALARAAAALDCPALADASPRLFEAACAGELARSPEWRALRAELGGAVRLVGPRVLGRAPYTADDPGAEGLELGAPEAADAAWIGGATLAAESFVTGERRLAWLPTFAAERDGEPVQVGPGERVLAEREIERATAAGFVALAPIRGDDALIVYGLG